MNSENLTNEKHSINNHNKGYSQLYIIKCNHMQSISNHMKSIRSHARSHDCPELQRCGASSVNKPNLADKEEGPQLKILNDGKKLQQIKLTQILQRSESQQKLKALNLSICVVFLYFHTYGEFIKTIIINRHKYLKTEPSDYVMFDKRTIKI